MTVRCAIADGDSVTMKLDHCVQNTGARGTEATLTMTIDSFPSGSQNVDATTKRLLIAFLAAAQNWCRYFQLQIWDWTRGQDHRRASNISRGGEVKARRTDGCILLWSNCDILWENMSDEVHPMSCHYSGVCQVIEAPYIWHVVPSYELVI